MMLAHRERSSEAAAHMEVLAYVLVLPCGRQSSHHTAPLGPKILLRSRSQAATI